MLFNSISFLFVFLPVAWLLFHVAERAGLPKLAIGVLIAGSFVFYAYWNLAYVFILGGSIFANYLIAAHLDALAGLRTLSRRLVLSVGIAANLGLLGWFKYSNFLVDEFNRTTGTGFELAHIALPIGISFFTFQQIAYLVDVYRRAGFDSSLLRYCLFVSFFPQLIAGPIVHHREMMPQFGRGRSGRIIRDLAIGGTIFVIGLAKKVIIADSMAVPADLVFDGAAAGLAPTLIDAWSGALCFAFQIYFDFSGYCDMAVGLARLFGIRLPMNFASPYKATSIIDFWRRWHITLSRFLRDYLYVPLGGNRSGPARRYVNVFITMVLGGIWHGAGWPFAIWGVLHGILIVINQGWRHWQASRATDPQTGRTQISAMRMPVGIQRAAIFVLIVLTWVPFRAADAGAMTLVYAGMAGLNGISLPAAFAPVAGLLPGIVDPPGVVFDGLAVDPAQILLWIPALLCLVWLCPNSMEIMRGVRPIIATKGYPATHLSRSSPARPARFRPVWLLRPRFALATGLVLAVCLIQFNDPSRFLYFQF